MEEVKLASTQVVGQRGDPGSWIKSWQLGQVFEARVLEQLSPGKLVLRIAGHQVVAQTETPAGKGAALYLEVNGLAPAASMKVISAPSPTATQVSLLEGQMQQLLPRQGNVAAPFQTLFRSAQGVNLLSLLDVGSGQFDRLYASLPRYEWLADSRRLRESLFQSGLFLESELLSATHSPGFHMASDIKATLLRLLFLVNQQHGSGSGAADSQLERGLLIQLQRELEGAVATLTLNQLASCPVKERAGGVWLFDMPFRYRGDLSSLSLSVEKEGSAGGGHPEPDIWKVLLCVILSGLGAVEARIYVCERKVSVVFYAERGLTGHLLEERLHQLRGWLESRGLIVSVLRCHQSGPCAERSNAQWRLGVAEHGRGDESIRSTEVPDSDVAGDSVHTIEAAAAREKIPLLQGSLGAVRLSQVSNAAEITALLYRVIAEVLRYIGSIAELEK